MPSRSARSSPPSRAARRRPRRRTAAWKPGARASWRTTPRLPRLPPSIRQPTCRACAPRFAIHARRRRKASRRAPTASCSGCSSPLNLEPLFRAEITLAPPQELGDTPLGRRRIIGITGGRFAGGRLSGRVLPGGADWQIIRSDGVTDFDARYTLETGDGAPIYVRHGGYRHGPAEVIRKLLEG